MPGILVHVLVIVANIQIYKYLRDYENMKFHVGYVVVTSDENTDTLKSARINPSDGINY